MDEIIQQIVELLRCGKEVDENTLVKLMHAAARRTGKDKGAFAKRRLLPYYHRVKNEDPELWQSWHITPELERNLLAVLRMKPRRSASGVATITVITKPWPCSGSCVFCPSDVRCPKSYLADEPACARAVKASFNPYRQVAARLTALRQMGHATDKIELIVLGGTWSDYPETYQLWFMRELFRALNDEASVDAHTFAALTNEPDVDAAEIAEVQRAVSAGELTYNQAIDRLYLSNQAFCDAAQAQTATWADLEYEHTRNEHARHRVVGLVIETRPDAITPEALVRIRRMGATKIQMGVQSTRQEILNANGRGIRVEQIERAFNLLRLFGFKVHAHFMVNLLGETPEADKDDYERFVTNQAFLPDEIKLYPCALIESSHLMSRWRKGDWKPYSEDDLVDVLTTDVLTTPVFCRVSRMIRDFSTGDIVAGNKKPNLRQLVERRVAERCAHTGEHVREIRFREIATSKVDMHELKLAEVSYQTNVTNEYFLQWVTPQNQIVGFLRLSLPNRKALEQLADEQSLSPAPEEAMIREVHVYGTAERVGEAGTTAQHHGLGHKLIDRACTIAREAGYERINVISAIGTRAYYQELGFSTHGLYQQKELK